MSFDDAMRKLNSSEDELRRAQEKAKAAKDAYEKAVREAEQFLPRLTPKLIAEFRKFDEIYQSWGSDVLEVENPVWRTIVQLGMLINPEYWKRWNFEEDEND